MTALGNEAPAADMRLPAPGHSKFRTFGKAASITLALAAGTTLGYLAFRDKQGADRDYDRYQRARTPEEAAVAKQSVQQHDERARQYGLLGGLSVALGAAVWVF